MRVERRLAAIMAADVIGYSRLMGQDEEGTVRQIKALLQEVVRPAFTATRGRIVKTMGDGFLGEFASVVDAFECGVALQQAAGLRAIGVPPDEQIILRIGINVGEVITDDDGDVFGDGVNIAARLENLCAAGSICVSQRAWEDLRRLKVEFVDLGPQELKNINRPVQVFSYTPPALEPPKPPPRARGRRGQTADLAKVEPSPLVPPPPAPSRPSRPPAWLWGGGLAAALVAVGGAAVVLNRKPPPDALAFVTAQIAQTPCSWLRVSDHSSADGEVVYKLSGASQVDPATLARNVLAAAKASKVDVDRVITTDVAPLGAAQCAWIDALKPFRYAGVPRFDLRLDRMQRGVARAELTFDPQALGPLGAVYGIEPSGAVQRIVTRPELAGLKPPALVARADGTRTLNINTDQPGWNGVVFLQSTTPTPAGRVESAPRTDAERQQFAALAKAGGWRFELAWFRVEP